LPVAVFVFQAPEERAGAACLHQGASSAVGRPTLEGARDVNAVRHRGASRARRRTRGEEDFGSQTAAHVDDDAPSDRRIGMDGALQQPTAAECANRDDRPRRPGIRVRAACFAKVSITKK